MSGVGAGDDHSVHGSALAVPAGRSRTRALVREGVAAARSAPVASLFTLVVIAAMCAGVLLTAGRTVGAQAAVVGSIDSAGTRMIVVRADLSAGVTTSALDRIGRLDGVEWSAAFGRAEDVRNTRFASARVPLRLSWSTDWSAIGIDEPVMRGDVALASALAVRQLGMEDGVGLVESDGGSGWAVVGPVRVPDHLAVLEPMLIAPQPFGADQPVAVLIVVVERPELVGPVSRALGDVLEPVDASRVTIEGSPALAELRALVDRQLGAFGRGLTLGILALTGALTALTLFGVVLLRRKDFGRRRALGATRGIVVGLVLVQTTVAAGAGAVLGTLGALVALVLGGDPVPSVAYSLAVAVLAVVVAVVGALAPAVVAANREPIRELRVP